MMMQANQQPSLLRVSKDDYGDKYDDHFLELYKLLVDSSHGVSQRRTNANNYLLTVNASLVTLFAFGVKFDAGLAWNTLVPVAGIAICITWHTLIASYRSLNTAKFHVIHEMEQRLPVALFDYEWSVTKKANHTVLTKVEACVPFIFLVLYIALFAFSLSPSSVEGDSSLSKEAPPKVEHLAPPSQ